MPVYVLYNQKTIIEVIIIKQTTGLSLILMFDWNSQS